VAVVARVAGEVDADADLSQLNSNIRHIRN
jgi:hypothetical protein